MNPSVDRYDEMYFRPGPDDSTERLIEGRLSPADAPPSYSGVAELFAAMRAPADSTELAAQTSVVAAMIAEARISSPSAQPPRRRSVLSKVLTAKAAAVATIAAFGIGTAAAAATGALPGQTSHANSHADAGLAIAASHTAAGTNGKSNGKGHNSPTGSNSNSAIPATGPANSHAQFGLCTAFLAAQKSTNSTTSSPPQYNSTAFKALIAQNGGVAGTTTYCTGVVKSHPSESGSNDSTNSGKPSGSGKPANNPGSSHSQAPVSTPNSGGTSTADDASGGASSTGTSTANTASGGASSAGSANAAGH